MRDGPPVLARRRAALRHRHRVAPAANHAGMPLDGACPQFQAESAHLSMMRESLYNPVTILGSAVPERRAAVESAGLASGERQLYSSLAWQKGREKAIGTTSTVASTTRGWWGTKSSWPEVFRRNRPRETSRAEGDRGSGMPGRGAEPRTTLRTRAVTSAIAGALGGRLAGCAHRCGDARGVRCHEWARCLHAQPRGGGAGGDGGRGAQGEGMAGAVEKCSHAGLTP